MLKTSPVFENAYKKLNTAQRAAVTQTEGPVLVLAGPGTGKTQILAVRVGQILKTTDTQPRDILCLTFTNTGVKAMRKRLDALLGAAVAQQVNIFTFHSFCAQVLRERKLGLDASFADMVAEELAATELQRHRIVREILTKLPYGHPLVKFRGDVFYHVPKVLSLFSLMKREAISPDDMAQAVEAQIDTIHADPTSYYKNNGKNWKAGDIKPTTLELIESYRLTAAAAALLPAYNAELARQQLHDFEDMIAQVQAAFDNPELDWVYDYRERYLYYLIDEYQDTNGAQNKLLYTLLGDDPRPNVFVVGDDDQSIYRFQGANVRNIQDFLERYPTCEVIPLGENYRSSKPILDHAAALIRHSSERLTEQPFFQQRYPQIQKNIVAAGRNAHLSTAPQYRAYPDAETEAVAIAQDIQRLVADGTYKYNDIAVLYQKHKQVTELLWAFRQHNIPYVLHNSENLLEQDLVKKLLILMQCLYQYHQREHYQSIKFLREQIQLPHATLHLPYWHLDWATLHTALGDYRAYALRLREADSTVPHLFEFLAHWQPDAAVQPGLNPGPVQQLAQQLMAWSGRLGIDTPAQVAERIVQRGGILQYLLNRTDTSLQLLVLRAFYEMLETSAPDLDHLGQLLADLDEQQEYGILQPVRLSIGTAEGVQCLTVHSSKGQEFPLVYVIRCIEEDWGGAKQNASKEYRLPFLTKQGADDSSAILEEKRRLLYVALTRAQRQLVITYTEQNEKGDKRNSKKNYAAGLITQLMTDLEVKPQVLEPSSALSETLDSYLVERFNFSAESDTFLLSPEMIARSLQDFRLSATHLADYLRCGRMYYFNRVAKIPNTTQPAMVFGTAMHYALNMLFLNNKKHNKTFDSQAFVAAFTDKLQAEGRPLRADQLDRLLRLGQSLLPELYQSRMTEWSQLGNFYTELSLDAELDGIPLTGKIDRMDLTPDGWRIVDFKTGKDTAHKTTEAKLVGPTDKQPYGGDYWRQMVFYTLLTEAAKPQGEGRVAETLFEFVQPDNGSTFVQTAVLVTAEDRATVLEQIKIVHQGIVNQRFDKLDESQKDHKDGCLCCAYRTLCWDAPTVADETSEGA